MIKKTYETEEVEKTDSSTPPNLETITASAQPELPSNH